MRTKQLYPFIPTRPEWKEVPFAAAQAHAAKALGESVNVTFTGADATHFHFQVWGRLVFTLPRA